MSQLFHFLLKMIGILLCIYHGTNREPNVFNGQYHSHIRLTLPARVACPRVFELASFTGVRLTHQYRFTDSTLYGQLDTTYILDDVPLWRSDVLNGNYERKIIGHVPCFLTYNCNTAI